MRMKPKYDKESEMKILITESIITSSPNSLKSNSDALKISEMVVIATIIL